LAARTWRFASSFGVKSAGTGARPDVALLRPATLSGSYRSRPGAAAANAAHTSSRLAAHSAADSTLRNTTKPCFEKNARASAVSGLGSKPFSETGHGKVGEKKPSASRGKSALSG
jgi:hypothetical protein